MFLDVKFSSSKDAAALNKRLKNSNVGKIRGEVIKESKFGLGLGEFSGYVASLSER